MFLKEYLKEEINKINENFKGTFVNKIIEVSNTDFVFYFSRNKNNGLMISSNITFPFLKLIDKKLYFSLNTPLLNKIKSYLLNSYLLEASLLNDDNIVGLNFVKTSDTYDKEFFTLIFEVFKANNNIIIVKNEKIIDALHFKGLETTHPIINGLTYVYPNKALFAKEMNSKNFEFINNYINNLEENYLKEKYITVISSLKRKRKTLLNKLNNLESDKEKDLSHLIYKDYGDLILSNLDKIKKGNNEFNYLSYSIPLKKDYTPIENSQYYYKQYKKAKTSLSLIDNYIKDTQADITYIDNILKIIPSYKEEDYLELIQELINKKFIKIRVKNIPKNLKNAAKPYYFLINDVKIGFGKNVKQNNELTFKYAKKDNYFLHTKEGSGAHVIIFSDTKNKEIIELACATSLYLSGLKDGDVIYTKVQNVKKSNTLGLVNLLKYETIHINNYDEVKIKNLISEASRF